ncbi:hypothetical protein QYM36_002682 [Artemia franciscana]|uniref:Uncharacterized protein n=1 Tax=Artemia franciscana TaxID=6661 RepID=A0AA88KTQ0_ARTSF|nr:hypothetical protein QYM36_016425 [Artemia franciscana]KAK2722204.1 hypothetical protein QYM36_002682 [Artemia franciscana]
MSQLYETKQVQKVTKDYPPRHISIIKSVVDWFRNRGRWRLYYHTLQKIIAAANLRDDWLLVIDALDALEGTGVPKV